mmetsp:Transcript_343/g.991  ORF Transcript_343/g.991 Transcript_343/m.991 type:complete len:235 (+) Transcript_343:360-1064(+)
MGRMIPHKLPYPFRVSQIKFLQFFVRFTHARPKPRSQIAPGQNTTQISSIGPVGRRIPIAYRLDPMLHRPSVEDKCRVGIRGVNFLQMRNLRERAQGLYFVVVVIGVAVIRINGIHVIGIPSHHGQRMFRAVHLPKDTVRSASLEGWPSPENVALDAHGAEGLRPGIAPTATGTTTLGQDAIAPGTGPIVVVVDLARKVRGADPAAAEVGRDARGAGLGQTHDEDGRGQLEFGA